MPNTIHIDNKDFTIKNGRMGSFSGYKQLPKLDRRSLTKKLDRLHSEWIRRKDAVNEVATCVTCGKKEHWKEMDCGHFVSRTCLALRWTDENTAVQCKYCNRFREGMRDEYALYLQRKYGADILEKLNKQKWLPIKISELQLWAMCEDYKLKLKNLLCER